MVADVIPAPERSGVQKARDGSTKTGGGVWFEKASKVAGEEANENDEVPKNGEVL